MGWACPHQSFQIFKLLLSLKVKFGEMQALTGIISDVYPGAEKLLMSLTIMSRCSDIKSFSLNLCQEGNLSQTLHTL